MFFGGGVVAVIFVVVVNVWCYFVLLFLLSIWLLLFGAVDVANIVSFLQKFNQNLSQAENQF